MTWFRAWSSANLLYPLRQHADNKSTVRISYRILCIPSHLSMAWSSASSRRSPSCGHSGYGGAPQIAQLASMVASVGTPAMRATIDNGVFREKRVKSRQVVSQTRYLYSERNTGHLLQIGSEAGSADGTHKADKVLVGMGGLQEARRRTTRA